MSSKSQISNSLLKHDLHLEISFFFFSWFLNTVQLSWTHYYQTLLSWFEALRKTQWSEIIHKNSSHSLTKGRLLCSTLPEPPRSVFFIYLGFLWKGWGTWKFVCRCDEQLQCYNCQQRSISLSFISIQN